MPGPTEQAPDHDRPAPPYRLLYDGKCPFCRREVNRLVRLSGGAVVKETVQSAWPAVPPPDEIKLVTPNGTIYGGAEAIAHTLGRRPIFRLIVWVYFVPGMRRVFDALYGWVAANRYWITAGPCPEGTCDTHDRQFVMTDAGHLPVPQYARPSYRRSTKLFFVLFGLIYASAFASLYVQVPTLIGSNGLLPVTETLETVTANVERAGDPPATGYAEFPTLFWFDASDPVLRGACIAGFVLALCVATGFYRGTALLLCGAVYLSYVVAGRTFFSFQWDNLLIESTLHALLLPVYSWGVFGRKSRSASRLRLPSVIAVFLVQWLLFRVYFESGIAKILYAGGGWRDLTAMSHYYNTAPLATWVGWYAHNLPQWWHRWETLLTLLIEIVLPVFIFAGRRRRQLAFCVFQLFQVLIILTANYGIFNYLSIALGFFLLEDRDYDPLMRFTKRLRRAHPKTAALPVHAPHLAARALRTVVLAVIACAVVTASLVEFSLVVIRDPDYRRQAATWRYDCFYGRLRLINSYHLFANMTEERLVPRIEGLNAAGEWVPYRYRFAPADDEAAPRFLAPHHPRLDFQLWFVTLSGNGHRRPFFVRLIERLCERPGFAASVFREDPFAGSAPRKIRVVAYRYDMTTPEERARTGAWWHDTPVRTLVPERACHAVTPED